MNSDEDGRDECEYLLTILSHVQCLTAPQRHDAATSPYRPIVPNAHSAKSRNSLKTCGRGVVYMHVSESGLTIPVSTGAT